MFDSSGLSEEDDSPTCFLLEKDTFLIGFVVVPADKTDIRRSRAVAVVEEVTGGAAKGLAEDVPPYSFVVEIGT